MDKFKNTLGMVLLTILILLFVVGGYVAMLYFTKDPTDENKKTVNKKTIDLRIDKSADYLYYDNEDELISNMEIEYLEPVINIQGMEDVNNKLKQEALELRSTIKYTKDMKDVPEDATINEEGIYSLTYRDYRDYSYENYLSLEILEYKYDIVNGSNPVSLSSYVVDKETGKQYTNEELLEKYNLTMDKVKAKVKEKLENNLLLYENTDVKIDIEASLNNLNTYALYVNKFGDLEITFTVKASGNNFNDSVTVSD